MPIIIDGYNLLWSIQKSDQESDPISDVQMCHFIGRYLKLIGDDGQIVFDGTGPPEKSGFDNISNLEVFFTGIAADADTVIEDKILANTSPKRLTVISNDRRLKDAARSRKSKALKCEVFWTSVVRQLNRKSSAKEPTGKRKGLSTGETEQWLKFFDLE